MNVNQATIDLIKEFEGWRAEAYRDSAGVWTIGYGTTARAGVGIDPHAGMVITKKSGEWYLKQAVDKFAADISKHISAPINENEFGAFVSLTYNIGPGAFRKSSALRHFNAGDKAKAAKSILLWNKAGGKVLGGLVRRRQAEKDLFLTKPTSSKVKKAQPATLAATGGAAVIGGAVAADLPAWAYAAIVAALVGAFIIWKVRK